MVYIGIDPGKGGGIATIYESGGVYAKPMPATESDILAELGSEDGCRGMLERVHSSPQMGVVSAFTFGVGYGGLRMALVANGVPFDEVTPQKWQKALGCMSRGDKNVTKRRAQELFPGFKVTHAIADALLIAEYCRRLHKGILG